MQHFFINPESILGNVVTISDRDTLFQMKKVLRMRVGDTFIALDGSGYEWECRLREVDERRAIADAGPKKINEREPIIYVRLFQAMPKKAETFELILQKGTELGVTEFVPMVTEHTERVELPKPERLLRILKEAAEQCERGKIPRLLSPVKFVEAISTVVKGDKKEDEKLVRVLLHSRGEHPQLRSVFSQTMIKGSRSLKYVDIFIGPEGGFSEEEVCAAQKQGLLIASLGARILRTETAAIVAVAEALNSNI